MEKKVAKVIKKEKNFGNKIFNFVNKKVNFLLTEIIFYEKIKKQKYLNGEK